MNLVEKNGLKISAALYEFINNEAIPGTKVDSEDFWKNFSNVAHELAPINKSLIEKREVIQKKIDEWHKSNQGKEFDKEKNIKFLKSIGYLVEEKEDFEIETRNVDQEIASIAGPQLVVPVDNARYALNAANARWGSLYDALYGTDVIPGDKYKDYNSQRASKVVKYVRDFLNKSFPLKDKTWEEISKIIIKEDKLIFLIDSKTELKNNEQFIGFNGERDNPNSILLKNNNLHVDISVDPSSIVGKMIKHLYLIL